jgi:hypothetical protein
MSTTLRWPLAGFRNYIRGAISQIQSNKPAASILKVGFHRCENDDAVWLVRDVVPWSEELRVADPASQWIVGTRPEPPGQYIDIPPFASGRLDLGLGAWSDYAWASVRTSEGIQPLDVLDLIGPGLHRLRLTNKQVSPGDQLHMALQEEDPDRWSRTIGALGGYDIWQRLICRRVALVGVGRTGSLVATGLARLGLRELVLIDPDLVELQNLGEMDSVTQLDIGRPKVDAVADALRRIQDMPTMTVMPMALDAQNPVARRAIADCDVVITAVDNDAARLLAGWSALHHHQVLIDIGTGVLQVPQDEVSSSRPDRKPYTRRMGTDVRMILPGHGCLTCSGGVVRYHEALEILAGSRVNTPWNHENRAGSLRTINQMGDALAIQFLQDLAAERVNGSRWTRIEIDDAGRITSTDLPTRNQGVDSSSCSSCNRAGRGDIRLGLV